MDRQVKERGLLTNIGPSDRETQEPGYTERQPGHLAQPANVVGYWLIWQQTPSAKIN